MSVNCPPGTICSNPIITPVGTSETKIYTYTSTKVTQDSTGKVTGGETTIYYNNSTTPGVTNYVPAATTTDGGTTWSYAKDSSGNAILGTDAQKSLTSGALKTNTNQQITTAAQNAGLNQSAQTAISLSGKNKATSTETTSTDILSGGLGALNVSVDDGVYRKSYNNGAPIIYPTGITSKGQDYIQFDMFRYETRKFTEGGNDPFDIYEDRQLQNKMGTVILPIQGGITDGNSVDWSEGDMNALKAYAVKAAITGMQAPEKISSSIEETILNATKGRVGENITNAVQLAIAENITGTKGLLSRTTGAILNPNLELLFQGVSLRTFSFTFIMSPRNKDEAENVKKIIRFFKQGMSAKRASTELFLKAPNVFKIDYIDGTTKRSHRSINKIKPCALKNCTVDYAPNGTYMTFNDENKTMTSYRMSLQFGELEPLYDDDYRDPDSPSDSNGSESIGY